MSGGLSPTSPIILAEKFGSGIGIFYCCIYTQIFVSCGDWGAPVGATPLYFIRALSLAGEKAKIFRLNPSWSLHPFPKLFFLGFRQLILAKSIEKCSREAFRLKKC
jgi:hypothetical protein